MWPAMKNLNASLPNPVTTHLESLRIRPPSSPHPASFFDPPTAESDAELREVIVKVKAFAHDLLPPWLENHCYRVFAQGLAIADTVGWSNGSPSNAPLGWNRNIWFITALLHNIGWDKQGIEESYLSFEIYGGMKARELLISWNAPQKVADLVCEAILRHSGSVGSEAGRIGLIGALIQIGPGHDFLGGATPFYIHAEDNNAIVQRWPRLGLVAHAREIMIHEVSRKAGCLGSAWAPRLYRIADNVRCYKGFQGEATEDTREHLEWQIRRQKLGKW